MKTVLAAGQVSGPRWAALALGALLPAGLFGAAAYGAARWRKATRLLLSRLEDARLPSVAARYDAHEIEGLPLPVQRYFRAVLTDGQPLIAAVWLRQTGTINMSAAAQQWKPFTARQRVVTQRPGFDWNARIMLLPGLPVLVHDAYIAGSGLLRAALFGLIPVVHVAGSAEMARGELMRFFGEAAWYLTALLPSQGVRWQVVDDRSARATLIDGELALTLTFRFCEDGPIESVRAEARARVVGGTTSLAPWQGRFCNYALRDGMQVPLEGEAAWELPDGPRPYWRGTVTALDCEVVKR